ncbi:MAG: gliding motility-associated C-terminal domain-containing protein [Saprospiraceae bacterium]|nr:gliding motility-associated C-terminal domain-containing protein [Saprospiraceae bacterium]
MKSLLSLFFSAFALLLVAQSPVNDECNTAIDLGEVPFCSTPGQFTNVNATTSVIDPVLNVPSCFNNLADRDVWFKFTMPANGSITDVTISVWGNIGGNGTLQMPQVALYRGDCSIGGLAELDCAAAALNINEIQMDFLGLVAGETYYLRINDYSATAAPNAGTFKLCVEAFVPDYNMGETAGTESCSGTLWDSGGETNEYTENENHTFTICPTEFHQCIQITIHQYNIENNYDLLSIYQGQGTGGELLASFDGAGTIEHLNVPGTGCATIAFESDGSLNLDGFQLTWLCTPDVCPPNPPTPPSASDCEHALSINGCDTELPNVISLEPGSGDPDFIVDGVNAGCILGPSIDLNFSFFYFTAQADGKFSFLVKNNDPTDPSDIDFSVWGPIDSVSQICAFVSNNQPVRSSWTAAPDFDNPEGLTGLTDVNPYNGDPVTDAFDCGSPATPGQGLLPTDDSFTSALDVQQGKIYVVLLDDYTGAVESEDGISIDFSGTSEGVLDPISGGLTVSNDTMICPGESVQLQVTGGLDYAWEPSVGLSCNECPNPVATPPTEITYLVQVATTCRIVKDTVRISYLQLDLGPDAAVCLGASFTLNENPVAGSYSWIGSPGLSCTDCPSPVFTATQVGINLLIAQVTTPNCSASDTIRINVAGGQQPTPTILPDTTICAGESLTLGGPSVFGSTYAWTSNPPGFTSAVANPPMVAPNITTTYYLETTSGACIFPRLDSVVVRVFQSPFVSLINGATFCLGESILLGNTPQQPSTTFEWSPDNGSLNNTLTANPIATPATGGLHTYTVTATNPGCSISQQVSVNAVDLQLDFDVQDTVYLCKGNSVTFNATVFPGTTQVNWAPLYQLQLSVDGHQAIATPAEDTTYTATVTLPGCTKTKRIFVKVDSLPPYLNLSPVDTSICDGQQVLIKWPDTDPLYEPSLFPDLTFFWEPATAQLTPDSLPFLVVQPSDTIQYRRIAQNGACVDTSYATVNVIKPPEITILPELSTICPDSFILLIATAPGVDSLIWSPNNTLSCPDCLTPLATPTSTTTYTLSGKYYQCPVAKSVQIVVNPAPNYLFPNVANLCAGDQLTLNLVDDPSVTAYNWTSNPPSTIPQVAQPTVTLTGTGVQSITYYLEAQNGCSILDSFTVTFAGAEVDAIGVDTICPGDQKLLNAVSNIGGGMYSWSDGSTGQAVFVSPDVTTTYTVTYELNGCTFQDSVVISVQGESAEVQFPTDIILCPGDTILLNTVETLGASYTWSSDPPLAIPSVGIPPVIELFQSTKFTVEAKLGECTLVKTLDVTVFNANLTVSQDIETCAGDPFTISANGNVTGTYQWTPGPDVPSFTDVLNAAQQVDYALQFTYGTPGNECFLFDTVSVSTFAGFETEITADPDSAFNAGEAVMLDAVIKPSQSVNGFTFEWFENGVTPVGNGQMITVQPETVDTSIFYTVIVTGPSGCKDTALVQFRVYQPDVRIPNAFTPNGDGSNDTFGLAILEGTATVERMEIYNRWGQKIVDSVDPAATWDGRVNDKNAPSDVYVYVIKWRRGDGSLVIDKGEVTLIR